MLANTTLPINCNVLKQRLLRKSFSDSVFGSTYSAAVVTTKDDSLVTASPSNCCNHFYCYA